MFEARAMGKVDRVTLSESWEREEGETDGGRGGEGGESARGSEREDKTGGGGFLVGIPTEQSFLT